MDFFATAPKGLTDLLADELRTLGAKAVTATGSGVRFSGTLETGYRICLWSRIANRVLTPIARFRASTPEELYDGVKAIAWEEHMEADGSLAVDCTAIKSPIEHTRYAALKTKDAIVDRFRERTGQRPSVDLETPDLRLNLHLREREARLTLDLSGGSLHRRGYREAGAAAPLKENLAAGILMLAGWPAIAEQGGPLLDPMCGSATLAIEAALMAADIAPGLYREHFGFLYWKQHKLELWSKLWREAGQRRDEGLHRLPPIYAFDRDTRALDAAQANARRAGIESYLTLERHPLGEALEIPGEPPGLLVTNPPYGERLGEMEELRPLYARLGNLLRAELAGWQGAVFTANPELAAHIGLKSERPLELFNGPIACKLFRYRGREEKGGVTVRPELAETEGARMFANRLRKNLKHLGKWARREEIDCYRLYDADLPEYAVAVDLYQGEKLWVHVQEYQAPRSVDPDKALQRLQEALAVIPQVLEIPVEQLFFKVRQQQKGKAQYRKQGKEGRFHQVREGNCRFWVNFTDYLDTGLFLDHRPTRELIEREAKGKRFLNLFCYTGAASVHAAVGGASRTTSVDLSATYLDWASRNMELNGVSPYGHEMIQADCMAWIAEEARRGKRQYELIFIDPPTFSSSKRMEGVFDVQRDHVELLSHALRLLAPGGTLLFSNNFRKFRLDEAALKEQFPELRIEDISRQSLPKDFERNPKVHRCWRMSR